jgi:hypothetical protein
MVPNRGVPTCLANPKRATDRSKKPASPSSNAGFLLLSVATIPLLQNNYTFNFTKFATTSTYLPLLLRVNATKKYAAKVLTYKSAKEEAY